MRKYRYLTDDELSESHAAVKALIEKWEEESSNMWEEACYRLQPTCSHEWQGYWIGGRSYDECNNCLLQRPRVKAKLEPQVAKSFKDYVWDFI